ncbi:MAG: hypothetical protein AB7G17_07440 [Phycisphaerales bacterium]
MNPMSAANANVAMDQMVSVAWPCCRNMPAAATGRAAASAITNPSSRLRCAKTTSHTAAA